MLNRRKAVVGWLTFMVARAAVRRKLHQTAASLRPAERGRGMFRKSRAAGKESGRGAASLVDSLKPVVERALRDPELHAALRQAFDTGRHVQSEVSGKSAGDAAKKVMGSKRLQREVTSSYGDLRTAVDRVAHPPKRRCRPKRTLFGIAALGAAAGALTIAWRKLAGGDGGVEEFTAPSYAAEGAEAAEPSTPDGSGESGEG